ncbi:tRNA (adenosine(37)-N6)-dimethylallyltransferase MiaA [Merismopedia glauca]|uniref:tRNA dimethylallyltransferase n=1 Tax=Merismopedia glauca CCAP 1448/3 TaxID=1296344 RepID=A0A2T1C7F6_9CYAN|nr:tRNA (adenosine(37)-N6)-dimethylallyltransferase MiaA [Merismopedia glauca]PSB04164.1 tRNA (adenosine(37)-N6)-dimethylallyltransferase MiaA [Merismopedia glauca CCAP 1448/3]
MYPTNSYPFGLIVICGATATGKSGLAVALAQRLNTIVLSADSRQVYRGFDIGTAKPTLEEQKQVPHYLIDLCDPQETLTVAQYQAEAQKLVSTVPFPILVGGTGLYIKSITKGLKIPRVAPQLELRSQLTQLGQSQLYSILQQVDPDAALKIHPNDPTRTLRALEVFYVTGIPISAQQGENPPSYPILHIGLECDRHVLTQRIRQRTEKMLGYGWETEVKALIAKYGLDLPLLDTLGYREMKRYLQGEFTLDEAIEETVLRTKQFAKRQNTWFRSESEIEWFDVTNPELEKMVWERVQKFMK